MWSGPLENLVSGLNKLLALDVRFIIPGHGPVATKLDVKQVINYWDFIHEAILKCFHRDMTPTEAAREVIFSNAFRDSAFAHWDSPERILTNAYTLYRSWGVNVGNLPGKLAIMDILRQQAMLAAELPLAKPKIMHRF